MNGPKLDPQLTQFAAFFIKLRLHGHLHPSWSNRPNLEDQLNKRLEDQKIDRRINKQ